MPAILASTLPKSGTHFLVGVLYRTGLHRVHGAQPAVPDGGYALDHYAHDGGWIASLRGAGVAVINLIRDPRDVLVSLAHHALAQPTDTHLQVLKKERSFEGALRRLMPLAARRLREADKWVADPGVLTLRFEDLVGPAGGGTLERQAQAAEAFSAWTGVEIGPEILQASYFPNSGTFRKGQIGGWKFEMPAEAIVAMSDAHAELIARWGYG